MTVAIGIVIVVVIAILANPQSLPMLTAPVPATPPATVPARTQLPVTTVITPSFVPTEVTPAPKPADAPPYQIFYSDNPLSFPRFKLPDNMETFGASEIPFRNQEMVPFAFVEDKRGGLTQKFRVPYPLWILNTTVTANLTPQYGNFRMVLAYASNGTIIEGQEILNRGTTYRVVQTSNTDLYMIITTAYIDRYRITLETPRSYYDTYHPG